MYSTGGIPSGLNIVFEARREARIHEQRWKALPKGLPGSGVVREAHVTPDNVLQQPHAWIFGQHLHHVVQHSTDCEEPLCCGTDVVQANLLRLPACELGMEHSKRLSTIRLERIGILAPLAVMQALHCPAEFFAQ